MRPASCPTASTARPVSLAALPRRSAFAGGVVLPRAALLRTRARRAAVIRSFSCNASAAGASSGVTPFVEPRPMTSVQQVREEEQKTGV